MKFQVHDLMDRSTEKKDKESDMIDLKASEFFSGDCHVNEDTELNSENKVTKSSNHESTLSKNDVDMKAKNIKWVFYNIINLIKYPTAFVDFFTGNGRLLFYYILVNRLFIVYLLLINFLIDFGFFSILISNYFFFFSENLNFTSQFFIGWPENWEMSKIWHFKFLEMS